MAGEYSIQHRPNNQNPKMIGKDFKTVTLFAGVRAIPHAWMMKFDKTRDYFKLGSNFQV